MLWPRYLCRDQKWSRFHQYERHFAMDYKKIIFLGSPNYAADVFRQLIKISEIPTSDFKVVAVVTKPPIRYGLTEFPTAVQLAAQELHIPVLSPTKASEPSFLSIMQEISPDLCITAAYGNYLPTKFLKIPNYGTVNIHPSLLPLYRGASPVQQCLSNGDALTGVTVLFSTKEMDAGPIIAQSKYPLQVCFS
jgi:methionyl-tRNA formyltransferase